VKVSKFKCLLTLEVFVRRKVKVGQEILGRCNSMRESRHINDERAFPDRVRSCESQEQVRLKVP
jgi:hypothetical protein